MRRSCPCQATKRASAMPIPGDEASAGVDDGSQDFVAPCNLCGDGEAECIVAG